MQSMPDATRTRSHTQEPEPSPFQVPYLVFHMGRTAYWYSYDDEKSLASKVSVLKACRVVQKF